MNKKKKRKENVERKTLVLPGSSCISRNRYLGYTECPTCDLV